GVLLGRAAVLGVPTHAHPRVRLGCHGGPGSVRRDHEDRWVVRLRHHVRHHLLRLVSQRAPVRQHRTQVADDAGRCGRQQELQPVTLEDAAPGARSFGAIAFDWGGVMTQGTFDSSAVVALARLLRTTPADLQSTYLDLMEGFEVGAFDMAGFHQRFVTATGVETPLDVFRTTFLGAVKERPAMYQLIGSLPAGIRVGVLSNNVPELCDVVRDDPRLGRVDAFVFSNE